MRYFCGTSGCISLGGRKSGSDSHLIFCPVSLSIALKGSKTSSADGPMSKKGSLIDLKGSFLVTNGDIKLLLPNGRDANEGNMLNGLSLNISMSSALRGKNVGVIVESMLGCVFKNFLNFLFFLFQVK
jgi:hypothetical protein